MRHLNLLAAIDNTDRSDLLRHLPIEEVLLPLLLQLAVIVLVARAFALLFRRLGQPSVMGEVVAGLVLGPSLLGTPWLANVPAGRFFHEHVYHHVFQPQIVDLGPDLSRQLLHWIVIALGQLGLILLLFLIGLEFDFRHLRWHGKSAALISLSGIACPFGLGFALAFAMHSAVAADINAISFALFLGTALSITAIPVLGRIMMELNITRTQLATVAVSAAAVDDALGWVLLASVAATVRAEFQAVGALLMIAETIAFTLFMVLAARPLLRAWARWVVRDEDGELSVNALAVLLVLVFVCAIVTNLIGIFAVFGAFVLGAALSEEQEFRHAVTRRVSDFVSAFFLPVFFAYTGLRTDLGALGSWQLWLLCGVVIAAAVAGKLGGCGLAAWFSGYSGREASCIGAMMNARGLMTLIVINLGRDLGVVPESVFSMLILMALITTAMTTPLLLRFMRGTELEPFIVRSGFGTGAASAFDLRERI